MTRGGRGEFRGAASTKDEVCPYNPDHLIRPERFQRHLIYCRKEVLTNPNHPFHSEALNFELCPFDANHHVHRDAMSLHTAGCPSRREIVKALASDGNSEEPVWRKSVVQAKSENMELTEDWEKGEYVPAKNIPQTNTADLQTHVSAPQTNISDPQTQTTGLQTHTTDPQTHTTDPQTHTIGPLTHPTGPQTHTTGPHTHTTGPQTYTEGPQIHNQMSHKPWRGNRNRNVPKSWNRNECTGYPNQYEQYTCPPYMNQEYTYQMYGSEYVDTYGVYSSAYAAAPYDVTSSAYIDPGGTYGGQYGVYPPLGGPEYEYPGGESPLYPDYTFYPNPSGVYPTHLYPNPSCLYPNPSGVNPDASSFYPATSSMYLDPGSLYPRGPGLLTTVPPPANYSQAGSDRGPDGHAVSPPLDGDKSNSSHDSPGDGRSSSDCFTMQPLESAVMHALRGERSAPSLSSIELQAAEEGECSTIRAEECECLTIQAEEGECLTIQTEEGECSTIPTSSIKYQGDSTLEVSDTQVLEDSLSQLHLTSASQAVRRGSDGWRLGRGRGRGQVKGETPPALRVVGGVREGTPPALLGVGGAREDTPPALLELGGVRGDTPPALLGVGGIRGDKPPELLGVGGARGDTPPAIFGVGGVRGETPPAILGLGGVLSCNPPSGLGRGRGWRRPLLQD